MGLELDYIFHPRSMAVAGASASPEKAGHTYFKNLLDNFTGKAYPVNQRAEEILGVPAYKSVRDLPEDVDYVISAIPNRDILDLVDACAAKHAKVLHLFTARFSETGHEKETALEQELLQRARVAGIRIIGPNCMGLYYPREGISFGRGFPTEPGSIGILAQSGGIASEAISVGGSRGLRFSKVVSYGNAIDVTEAELLEYLADDPETAIIGGYVEGVREGPRFVKALHYAVQRKPVVLLKGGRTPAGTAMASSHTASLAGTKAIWEALCRQAGAINTSSMEEFLDTLVAFRFMPPTLGYNVVASGATGGGSVLTADECAEAGLNVLPIPSDVRQELVSMDPFFGPWLSNPLDISVIFGGQMRTDQVLELMARSPSYHMLVHTLWGVGPGFGADPRFQQRFLGLVNRITEMAGRLEKPVALVMRDFVPETEQQLQMVQEVRQQCLKAGIPIFPSVRRASWAIRYLVDYYRRRDGMEGGGDGAALAQHDDRVLQQHR